MKLEIKIIHTEWEDNLILDFETHRLNRINASDEYGDFIINKNKLFINWDKWNNEIFISYKNNNVYYIVKEVNFYHNDWTDICYIDNINNILYRKSNNMKGIINNINDEIIINWINEDIDIFFDENQLSENDININIDKNEQHVKKYNEKTYQYNTVNKNINNQKIPNIIHFVYGFKEKNLDFELYKYIAIKSAHEVNKPDKIYFYYYYEPEGYWWNKIKKYLTLVHITPPKEIYGNKLYHYAHKADIIRLQKLIEHGGIYLDIDTICLKSFCDLLHYDFVMGKQTNFDNTSTYGLCNAVILSAPNSFFAQKWLETYKTFRSKGRDSYWDEHSVLKPLTLSNIYSEHIKILDYNKFFYPLWYDINNILFNNNFNIEEYKSIITNNYCIHLWDTYSNNYLKNLTENFIFDNNTLYNIFSRKFLKNKISIVMLTYNRLDITKRCLESYLKCLNNDYIEEMIILDNDSNTELVEYLKEFQEYHEKIKLIFLSENLGVCGGRSILFKEAIGDIIISIDSDAYLISNNFFDKIINILYNEKYGIVGISGAYIRDWTFGSQEDIDDDDDNEYLVDHIAGCCQAFRRDLFNFGFGLDPYYGKFWVEDTDLSMQVLELNKFNYRISQKNYLEHHWGGSGKNFEDLFKKNWEYFENKWKGRVLKNI
jgi:GT2 family glycosyltransferase/mannosyltransferase OCH1-like enzyme